MWLLNFALLCCPVTTQKSQVYIPSAGHHSNHFGLSRDCARLSSVGNTPPGDPTPNCFGALERSFSDSYKYSECATQSKQRKKEREMKIASLFAVVSATTTKVDLGERLKAFDFRACIAEVSNGTNPIVTLTTNTFREHPEKCAT